MLMFLLKKTQMAPLKILSGLMNNRYSSQEKLSSLCILTLCYKLYYDNLNYDYY